MSTLSLNERAWLLADDCARAADELRLRVTILACGARIIDAGIEAPGGVGAGLSMARIGMAGLGHV